MKICALRWLWQRLKDDFCRLLGSESLWGGYGTSLLPNSRSRTLPTNLKLQIVAQIGYKRHLIVICCQLSGSESFWGGCGTSISTTFAFPASPEQTKSLKMSIYCAKELWKWLQINFGRLLGSERLWGGYWTSFLSILTFSVSLKRAEGLKTSFCCAHLIDLSP